MYFNCASLSVISTSEVKVTFMCDLFFTSMTCSVDIQYTSMVICGPFIKYVNRIHTEKLGNA